MQPAASGDAPATRGIFGALQDLLVLLYSFFHHQITMSKISINDLGIPFNAFSPDYYSLRSMQQKLIALDVP